MILNNNVLFESEGGLYVPKETGKFYIELLSEGNEVTIFQISMRKGPSDTFANFDITNKGLKIVRVTRRGIRIWAYIKAFFVGIVAIIKSDFVYIFYPGPICAVFAMLCVLLGKKFGIYVRGEQGIANPLSKLLYGQAELVLTVSPKFTQIIREFGGNSFTIRPMFDVVESDAILDRRYLKRPVYNLLYVGRTVRDKGLFELLSAAKQLKDAGHDNFHVHIVGDGIDLAEMKVKVKENLIDELITFHGMVSDKDTLRKFYLNSDLFVLPTYHEGFPRVLYEAMIFGVPIITTFVGTISYIMKDKINCYRIEPESVSSLKNEILSFLTSYEAKAVVAKFATTDILDYLSDKKDKHAVQLSKFISKFNN